MHIHILAAFQNIHLSYHNVCHITESTAEWLRLSVPQNDNFLTLNAKSKQQQIRNELFIAVCLQRSSTNGKVITH